MVCIGLILLTTYIQYNATYFATYTESGVRRITLAERLRKIPLSFFGKKDLADLTSTIMADCTFLEQSFSHFIPELAGSIVSTILISIGLLAFDWRMALAALWVLPVAFAIVGFSAKVQERLNQKAMDVKMACADGIQECIETVRAVSYTHLDVYKRQPILSKLCCYLHYIPLLRQNIRFLSYFLQYYWIFVFFLFFLIAILDIKKSDLPAAKSIGIKRPSVHIF